MTTVNQIIDIVKDALVTEDVNTTNDANLSTKNGTIHVLKLVEDSTLTTDLKSGQSVCAHINLNGFELNTESFKKSSDFELKTDCENAVIVYKIGNTTYLQNSGYFAN